MSRQDLEIEEIDDRVFYPDLHLTFFIPDDGLDNLVVQGVKRPGPDSCWALFKRHA